jgi:hypothetical protein
MRVLRGGTAAPAPPEGLPHKPNHTFFDYGAPPGLLLPQPSRANKRAGRLADLPGSRLAPRLAGSLPGGPQSGSPLPCTPVSARMAHSLLGRGAIITRACPTVFRTAIFFSANIIFRQSFFLGREKCAILWMRRNTGAGRFHSNVAAAEGARKAERVWNWRLQLYQSRRCRRCYKFEYACLFEYASLAEFDASEAAARHARFIQH